MTDAVVVLELRALRLAVAELVADQQHVERRRLAADDRRIGIALLPLAAALVEDARFTGEALFEIALDDRTPVGQAVREILRDYGSLRALGKLLVRLEGIALAGCRLVAAGSHRGDRAWRIASVSDE